MSLKALYADTMQKIYDVVSMLGVTKDCTSESSELNTTLQKLWVERNNILESIELEKMSAFQSKDVNYETTFQSKVVKTNYKGEK